MNILTSQTFNDFIKSQKVVVVKFFATWCGPCKMYGPVLEEVSKEINDVAFGSVDIDQEEALASQYKVTTVPTTIVFVDGKPVNQFVGFKPKQQVIEFINANK